MTADNANLTTDRIANGRSSMRWWSSRPREQEMHHGPDENVGSQREAEE
jgi:hypothetical protein